jgi:hypothetical protein
MHVPRGYLRKLDLKLSRRMSVSYVDHLSSDQSTFWFCFRSYNPPIYFRNKPRSRSELIAAVLASPRVRQVIWKVRLHGTFFTLWCQAWKFLQLTHDDESRKRDLDVESYRILDDMAHSYTSIHHLRWFCGLVRQLLIKQLHEGVLVNKGGIEQV